MREHPTIPPATSIEAKDAGEPWPQVHCAFVGCGWVAQLGTENDLREHLDSAHANDLHPARSLMLRGDADDAAFSVYSAAIAEKCREGAPLAGASFDRRALKSFADATTRDQAGLV